MTTGAQYWTLFWMVSTYPGGHSPFVGGGVQIFRPSLCRYCCQFGGQVPLSGGGGGGGGGGTQQPPMQA